MARERRDILLGTTARRSSCGVLLDRDRRNAMDYCLELGGLLDMDDEVGSRFGELPIWAVLRPRGTHRGGSSREK